VRQVLTGALCLTLAALAAAVILVHLFGDLPAALDTLAHGDEVGARIEESTRAVHRKIVAKDQAVEDAFAGRLTLLQAAARHRDLDANLPAGQRNAWRFFYDGATDEERYCRQVLDRAGMLAEGRPEGEAAVARLRGQLDQALADGGVRLPAAEPPGKP
jgi:hypothetical protein